MTHMVKDTFEWQEYCGDDDTNTLKVKTLKELNKKVQALILEYGENAEFFVDYEVGYKNEINIVQLVSISRPETETERLTREARELRAEQAKLQQKREQLKKLKLELGES